MIKKQKKALFICFLCSFYVILSLAVIGNADTKSLSITVQQSKVSIQADKVPLIDVLKSLSAKTGIIFQTSRPLTEKFSCNFNEIEINASIKRLMQNLNHAIVYSKNRNGKITPKVVVIMEKGSLKELTNQEQPFLNHDPGARKLDQVSFTRDLEDHNNLSGQISGIAKKPEEDAIGITLTSVSKNSIFDRIGLNKGDIVWNVNGTPVNSTDELIATLKTCSQAPPPSMIRIERIKENEEIEAIYLNLE